MRATVVTDPAELERLWGLADRVFRSATVGDDAASARPIVQLHAADTTSSTGQPRPGLERANYRASRRQTRDQGAT